MIVKETGKLKYAVQSESDKLAFYEITLGDKTTCNCKGFAMKGKCKHIDAALEYEENKGKAKQKPVEKPVPFDITKEGTGDVIDVTENKAPVRKTYKIKEEHIVYVPYKNHDTQKTTYTPTVLIDGYMDVACDVGFRKMFTKITQYPCKENNFTAFAECYILTSDGQEIIDIGDANEDNVKKTNIKQHFPRMAATRARGRALRIWLFPYVGMLCTEELDTTDHGGEVAGLLTKKQKDNIRSLLSKLKWKATQEQNIELTTFILNLSINDADSVIAKLKTFSAFDYNDFVTLRDEFKDIDENINSNSGEY